MEIKTETFYRLSNNFRVETVISCLISDQVSPTSGVGIPSTVLAVVNNQTPPTSKKTSPSTITVATRTTSAPSTGQCQSAARLCQMNCPGGYLVDPDDCTFCVCKKNTMAAGPQPIN